MVLNNDYKYQWFVYWQVDGSRFCLAVEINAAKRILEKAAESPASSVRFVGQFSGKATTIITEHL
jgi:hypothetical protein